MVYLNSPQTEKIRGWIYCDLAQCAGTILNSISLPQIGLSQSFERRAIDVVTIDLIPIISSIRQVMESLAPLPLLDRKNIEWDDPPHAMASFASGWLDWIACVGNINPCPASHLAPTTCWTTFKRGDECGGERELWPNNTSFVAPDYRSNPSYDSASMIENRDPRAYSCASEKVSVLARELPRSDFMHRLSNTTFIMSSGLAPGSVEFQPRRFILLVQISHLVRLTGD